MSNYINIIKESFFYFPLVAAILTIPYILFSYHRYGSLLSWRIAIVYSFIFYLLTAYFLVILPLPSIESVKNLQTPYCNLLPFVFIKDILKESGPLYSNRALWQFLFNCLMFLPLGSYLRYYFKLELKNAIIIAFLLSIFFELTQLSGLYFYYPRPYRLFDVDDLIANTLGSFLGYILAKPISQFLPDRKAIDDSAYRLAAKISPLRRLCALGIDGLLNIIILSILSIFINLKSTELVFFGYYVIFFWLFKGSSPGMRFVHISIADKNDNFNYSLIILRVVLFDLCYFRIPLSILKLVGILTEPLGHDYLNLIVLALIYMIYLFYLLSQFIGFLLNRELIYEKLSFTHLISTLKI